MEKKSYSVQWLSESSHRNTTYPSVDLLTCRSGTSALQYHKELSALEMEQPITTTICNEKENHFDHTTALYQVQRTQAEAHDVIMSRKSFKKVSLCKPSPVPEKHQCLDTDSAKSPESLSEEEATSRPRTKFTKEQLRELEKSFKEHRYIGSNEKKRLSKVLKLSENQIKTWFQNRRMKFKRQSQDAQVGAFFSGLYMPYYGYSDFQTPAGPALPGLAMPLAPPASTPHLTPLSATVIRPGNPSSSMLPSNLGSYPCPSVLIHPSLKESAGLRYSPY
ncbi:PREDICTED: homeobox protein vex1-like [Nanorana parkeri]|uniref:homeobox protein vex1-like n=1 Tax=Nanorana parkeri TaxID=125878 RepID=UPI000854A741|nr:PREDICTED: homeobox protein vex1-like [Nanorana parkeri]